MSQEPRRRSRTAGHTAAWVPARASAWAWRLPTSLVLLVLTTPVLLLAALITLPFVFLGGSHAGAASPADLLRLYLHRLPL